MKKLSRIKIWTVFVLIVSGLAGLALITSCGTGDGTKSTSSSSSSGSSSSGDGDDEITLTCSSLSENGSCGKESKCVDSCEDELNLSNSQCKKLDEDTVKDLVNKLFGDGKALDRPTTDSLNDVDGDDLELLCGAVKTVGKDILEGKVDNYTRSRAETFLIWMAEKDEVMDVFKTIEEEEGVDDAKELLKTLLEKVSGSTGKAGVLEGLKEQLGEDSQHLLEIAQKKKNEKLIRYVHNEIIDDKGGLCDNDNTQPITTQSIVGAVERKGLEQEACVLGVYCTIASPNASTDDSAKFRKKVAEIMNTNFISLVKQSVSSGGFGLTEDDAEEWTNNACWCLHDYWESSGSLLVIDFTPGTCPQPQ